MTAVGRGSRSTDSKASKCPTEPAIATAADQLVGAVVSAANLANPYPASRLRRHAASAANATRKVQGRSTSFPQLELLRGSGVSILFAVERVWYPKSCLPPTVTVAGHLNTHVIHIASKARTHARRCDKQHVIHQRDHQPASSKSPGLKSGRVRRGGQPRWLEGARGASGVGSWCPPSRAFRHGSSSTGRR
jgi:hypothetical protein